jgi:hypothetical protein
LIVASKWRRQGPIDNAQPAASDEHDHEHEKTGFKIMNDTPDAAPDSTAARVALWRALHVEADAPPHVLADEIGLKLLAPDKD